MLELLKPRVKKLDDIVEVGRFFFVDVPSTTPRRSRSTSRPRACAAHLRALDDAFGALATFDAGSTEAALRTVADATGVKAATLIHAVRVAVTGSTASPGLFEVLALLGRERTRARLAAALQLISVAHS